MFYKKKFMKRHYSQPFYGGGCRKKNKTENKDLCEGTVAAVLGAKIMFKKMAFHDKNSMVK